MGQLDAAREQVKFIKQLSSGLDEWQTILEDKQADTLRAVIGDDVAAAQALVAGELEPADLVKE